MFELLTISTRRGINAVQLLTKLYCSTHSRLRGGLFGFTERRVTTRVRMVCDEFQSQDESSARFHSMMVPIRILSAEEIHGKSEAIMGRENGGRQHRKLSPLWTTSSWVSSMSGSSSSAPLSGVVASASPASMLALGAALGAGLATLYYRKTGVASRGPERSPGYTRASPVPGTTPPKSGAQPYQHYGRY